MTPSKRPRKIHLRDILTRGGHRLKVTIEPGADIIELREHGRRKIYITTLSSVLGRAWYECCLEEAARIREARRLALRRSR
jgi:hypothetical protein